MAAYRIDIASERLALELSREDVETELHNSQSVAENALLTDRRVAIDLQLQELARLEDAYAGQRMQQSLYTAMLADSCAIADQRRLEEQAINDRIAVAAVVGPGLPQIPDEAHQQITSGNYNDERLTQLEKTGLVADDDLSDSVPTEIASSVNGDGAPSLTCGGSTTLGEEQDTSQVTLEQYVDALRLDETQELVDCVVCTNSFSSSQTVTLQCGDTWCRACISRRYEEAIVNEGAWPVKCCRIEVSLESVRRLVSLDLCTRFAIKAVEWSDADRTYCHEPSCSTYMPHSSITDRCAPCSACHRETCAECKGPYHAQPPCPEDTTNDDLLTETARANGWPKCPGCRRYVEITHGCNHMTCLCRTEFCYVCEATWKSCPCAQWDEERLYDRAENVAFRQGRVDVDRVARELVSRHNCHHNRGWTRIGGGECDECNHTLPNFLYRCSGCHLDVCSRCRFNRI